jgi:hypothetical protein
MEVSLDDVLFFPPREQVAFERRKIDAIWRFSDSRHVEDPRSWRLSENGDPCKKPSSS